MPRMSVQALAAWASRWMGLIPLQSSPPTLLGLIHTRAGACAGLAVDAAETAVRPKQASAPAPAMAAARSKRDHLVAADRSIIPAPFISSGSALNPKTDHPAAAPESTPGPPARQGSSPRPQCSPDRVLIHR